VVVVSSFSICNYLDRCPRSWRNAIWRQLYSVWYSYSYTRWCQ